MQKTSRLTNTPTALLLAALGFLLTDGQAFAGWPHHQNQQVVYTTQPQAVVTAQAPVMYTAQAPATYAQAPVTYAQAPATYAAQAPVTYVAQAPATYTMTTGSAPAVNASVGAAPGVGNAPGAAGIRISTAVRNAIYADLVALYHGEDSGTTRLEKLKAVRESAKEEYAGALDGEDESELNKAEEQDVRDLVDSVISGGAPGSQRTYYPPWSSTNVAWGRPGVGMVGGVTLYQPTTLYVPVLIQPAPQHHKHFHKN